MPTFTNAESGASVRAKINAAIAKVDGVEDGATADQTGTEIKAAYEAEADTNAFTDAEKAKLTGVEDGATDDQTGAEMVTAIDAELGQSDWQSGGGGGATDLSATYAGTTVTIESSDGDDVVIAAATGTEAGVMTAADRTKLDGIDDGATDDQTGAEMVSAIDTELGSSDWQSGGGGGGATDLSATYAGSTVTIESSDGADVVIAAATGTEAGVMTAEDRTKLDGISGSGDPASFETRTEAAAATIDAGVTFLRTASYAALGDGGGALYMDMGETEPIDYPAQAYFESSGASARWWLLVPEHNTVTTAQFGASVGASASVNRAAIQAALDFDHKNDTRGEYQSTPKVLLAHQDGNYLLNADLIVRRQVVFENATTPGRGTGASKLVFTSGATAGIWCKHPGGGSGETAYNDSLAALGHDDAGAIRPKLVNLIISAENDGDIDFGIIHNTVCVFEGVVVEKTARAAFFAHAWGTQGDALYGSPDVVLTNQATMYGNCNFSRYDHCVAKGNLGHGFVAIGVNAQIMTYLGCDASANNGCGFRDVTIGGNIYFGCHTAQNSIKVHYDTAISTTLADDVDDSGEDVVIQLTDATGFFPRDGVRFTLADATVWQGVIASEAGSVNYDANTIVVNVGPPSIASSGATVEVWRTYLPIKAHTSNSANDEPEVGSKWRDYWWQVTSSQSPDFTWADATAYRDAGGVNTFAPTSNGSHVEGHYSENGIEGGVILRGSSMLLGGVAAFEKRFYIPPTGTAEVQVYGSIENTPYAWFGVSDDRLSEYGSALGTDNRTPVFFQMGHSEDPAYAGSPNVFQRKWSSARDAYVDYYDNDIACELVPEGWTNFNLLTSTALGSFDPKGRYNFPRGFFFGLRGASMFGCYSLTNPVDPIEVPKGAKLSFTDTTTGQPHMLHVLTGGKLGALTWDAAAGTITNGASVSGGEVKAVLETVTPHRSQAEIVAAIDAELGSSDWQLGGGGGGATDLSTSRDATTVTVESDTGTDAVLPAADATNAGVMASADKVKLDGIEDDATADMTGAEIATAYEGEADRNAFTDAEKTKLTNIETEATADQTGAEMVSAIDTELGSSDWQDSGGGERMVFYPASSISPNETSGATPTTIEGATNDVTFEALEFSNVTQEYATLPWVAPPHWDGSDLRVRLRVARDAGGSLFDVSWKVSALGIGDGDAFDAAFGAEVEVVVTGGASKFDVSAKSGTITPSGSPAAGDDILIQFTRDIGDGDDDQDVAAWLRGVEVFYTTTQAHTA